MRLSVRRIVVLPQPDGPMNAVTARSSHVEGDVAHGRDAVVAHRQSLHLEHGGARGAGGVLLLGAHLEGAQRDVAHARQYRNGDARRGQPRGSGRR